MNDDPWVPKHDLILKVDAHDSQAHPDSSGTPGRASDLTNSPGIPKFPRHRGLVVYPSGYTLGFYATGPWAPWEGPGVPYAPWVWALGAPRAPLGPVGPKGIPEWYTTFR